MDDLNRRIAALELAEACTSNPIRGRARAQNTRGRFFGFSSGHGRSRGRSRAYSQENSYQKYNAPGRVYSQGHYYDRNNPPGRAYLRVTIIGATVHPGTVTVWNLTAMDMAAAAAVPAGITVVIIALASSLVIDVIPDETSTARPLPAKNPRDTRRDDRQP